MASSLKDMMDKGKRLEVSDLEPMKIQSEIDLKPYLYLLFNQEKTVNFKKNC